MGEISGQINIYNYNFELLNYIKAIPGPASPITNMFSHNNKLYILFSNSTLGLLNDLDTNVNKSCIEPQFIKLYKSKIQNKFDSNMKLTFVKGDDLMSRFSDLIIFKSEEGDYILYDIENKKIFQKIKMVLYKILIM